MKGIILVGVSGARLLKDFENILLIVRGISVNMALLGTEEIISYLTFELQSKSWNERSLITWM